MSKKETKLTGRQARFVQEYLIDFNGTQACIRAGYSANAAKEQATRLLTYAHVKKAIEEGKNKIMQRVEITQERVVNEYAKIAFCDTRQFFCNDGRLKPVSEWTEEMAACVSALDIAEFSEEAIIKKLKLIDRKGALDSLARYLGMFKDKVEVSVDASLAERLARAKERETQP